MSFITARTVLASDKEQLSSLMESLDLAIDTEIQKRYSEKEKK
jgi:hypothetical protein